MNPAALEEIRDLVGEEKTRDLLGGLAADLRSRFTSPSAKDLAFDAHTTISCAGMLGFVTLANLCREIEEACRAGADLTILRAQLNKERRRVLSRIKEMRRAA